MSATVPVRPHRGHDSTRCNIARGPGLALLLSGALLAALPADAAVLYVGIGPTCTASNHYDTIDLARFAAQGTPEADEIRVTRTQSYPGESHALVDFDPATSGALSIAGGFDDCSDTSPGGRTTLTPDGPNAFWIFASTRPTSVVTLRDLEISGGSSRALEIQSGGHATLENVRIADHDGGGVTVTGGGTLYADADTSIADNGSLATPRGGGIHCSTGIGQSAFVSFAGKLERNRATAGGNLAILGDCEVHLQGGAVLLGTGQDAEASARSADRGGGIAMQGGTLYGHGGASRVVIRDHYASETGGGLHVESGEVSLVNTFFLSNAAGQAGGGIFTALSSLTMDRVAPCPFLISCSQLSRNRLRGGTDGAAIFQLAGALRLRRTMIDRHGPASGDGLDSLVHVQGSNPEARARLELDGVGLVLNEAGSLLRLENHADVVGQYVTAARNSSGAAGLPAVASMAHATMALHSSALDDTIGLDLVTDTVVEARCLLVDDANGYPEGSFVVGEPLFNSAGTGDIRQTAESPGVDFCDESAVPWPGGLDIELQARGFDSPTNPDGSPGISGGTFDAGMDEVTVGPPPPLFSDGFESLPASAARLP